MSWHLGVQILLPTEPGSLYGVAKYDEANYSLLSWWDISEWVRGMTWTRGALEFDARPDAGEATITLDNTAGLFSPVDPSNAYQGLVTTGEDDNVISYFFGPGTIVRIVAHDPDDPSDDGWVPQFTGIVSSWDQIDRALGVESSVEVVVWETLSAIANVNENAISLVGDDDIVYQRVRRLADAAAWTFGYIDATANAFDTFLLQSTNMAQNRLGDIYLAADSVGATARSDRSGALVVYGQEAPARGPASSLALASLTGSTTVRIDPEGLTFANDNECLINFVQFARAGGSVQTAQDAISIGRFRAKYTYGRNDLINKSNTLTLALAQALVDARGQLTDRIVSVNVTSLHGQDSIEFLVTADVHSIIATIEIEASDHEHKLVYSNVRIDAMTHTVGPLTPGQSQQWTCTYTLGRATGPAHQEI